MRKEVCIQENKSNPYLDQRSARAINNAMQRGVLRGNNDTPKKHSKVPVGQGGQKLDNCLKKTYHERQLQLFENHLLNKRDLRDLLPGIAVDTRQNRRGWLIRVADDGQIIELTTIEFCNVIDKISVFFLGKLRALRSDNRDVFCNQWKMTLEAVSKCCLDILVTRNGMDWCTDNDLMSGNYEIWKMHLIVLISFSALMAVTKMLRVKLE